MLSKIPKNLPPRLNVQLIRKYLNNGDLGRARKLFDGITEPDVHSWTVLISAYTKNGKCKEAVELYSKIKNSKNVIPDKLAILAAAKACAVSGDLRKAKEIHRDSLKYGFCFDLLLGNALIDMYGKCMFVDGAETVFRGMKAKDVITWTSFCSCYLNCGLPWEALSAFREMGSSGIRPNAVTLSSITPACSELKCLYLGREIHGLIIKNGFEDNAFVSSALVDMYSSCSSVKDAELVFYRMSQPDVVSWNVMISAYFLNKECGKGLDKFEEMRVRGVTLNADSWNTIISGCVDNGKAEKALELLGRMQRGGCKPNQITITSVLTACTLSEDWRLTNQIHGYVFRHSLVEDLAIGTALLLIYAKSGDLEMSNKVFYMMPLKDTIAWNTIIIANAMHGKGEESLTLFNQMVDLGVKPNSVTFTGVLSGCSHSKMVDDGLLIFHSMSEIHNVEPDPEHYSCMVDVLSRGGRLVEAYNFIQEMPVKPHPSAWGALLAACRVYKNVDLARIAANYLFKIEPDNPGNYVLLSNILVTAKLWGEASEIRKLMRDRGIKKVPGCSWVRVKNRVHIFVAGSKTKDQNDEIYKFLDEIRRKMKLLGSHPHTEFVLQDLDREEQEDSLCSHSEKLAVAFGILNSKGESSLKVFKNLRICGDCHNTIKFIAKSVGLQVIVRDSLRFHHFKDGLCSCGEFW